MKIEADARFSVKVGLGWADGKPSNSKSTRGNSSYTRDGSGRDCSRGRDGSRGLNCDRNRDRRRGRDGDGDRNPRYLQGKLLRLTAEPSCLSVVSALPSVGVGVGASYAPDVGASGGKGG